ncbi:uncharacterized protein SAPINGB_P001844 [Magnusiomyces paraingens]|uniref:PRKR-interacting protein 1 n=1 Tax=Magnusiomyces paraingens TaxID=2606893 RepID=A0A5E8BBH7_9ASCO|nr:uncharacterized protein SAPINGB_P001844 [Saprochaete ingens]VVT48571.1 unnamed protein product [Saprochaete ingens]
MATDKPDQQQKPQLDKEIWIKQRFNPDASDIQRKQLQELLKHPEREVELSRPSRKRGVSPPPEIVANVPSSSAGAGSGEFHVYKQARRKEYMRLKIFEEETREEKSQRDFEQKKAEMQKRDESKTNKNRAKRQRRKKNGAVTKDKESKNVEPANSEADKKDNDLKSKPSEEDDTENPNGNGNHVVIEAPSVKIIDDDDGVI